MRIRYGWFGMLLFFLTVPASAQGIITGKVLGYDGQPMKRADVAVVSNETTFPRGVIASYSVAADGTFEVPVDSLRLYRLRFSGASHRAFELPLYMAAADTIVVAVHLGTYRAYETEDIEHGMLKRKANTAQLYYQVGPGVDRALRQSVEIPKGADGLFRAMLPAPADTLAYYLLVRDRYSNIRWINGPEADYFVPDQSGDYYAVVHAPSDSVTLALDLDAIPPDVETRYEILEAPPETHKLLQVHEEIESSRLKARQYRAEQAAKGINPDREPYDYSDDIKEMERRVRKEKDPFLKQGWYTAYMTLRFSQEWGKRWSIDRKLAQDMLEEIPPYSPYWSYTPLVYRVLIDASTPPRRYQETFRDLNARQQASSQYLDYVDGLVYTHPDTTARRNFLQAAIGWASEAGQLEVFSEYYNLFMDEFGDTHFGDRMRKQYEPERIRAGQPVPDFAFASLDDPSEVYTRENLLGTAYLLNFWATWCAWCIEKMEVLERIHHRYEDQDFTVFTVSINFTREDALTYRKEGHPMPWLNAHIDDWKPGEGPVKDFEVLAIPYSILVDEAGTILAVDYGSEEALFNALVEHFEY